MNLLVSVEKKKIFSISKNSKMKCNSVSALKGQNVWILFRYIEGAEGEVNSSSIVIFFYVLTRVIYHLFIFDPQGDQITNQVV